MPSDIAGKSESLRKLPLSEYPSLTNSRAKGGIWLESSLVGHTERQRPKEATIEQLLPTESPEGSDSVVGCAVVCRA